MNITIGPSCNKNMDLDIALSSSSAPDATMAPVAVQAPQISKALAAAWTLGINIVSGGWPDPGNLQIFWWATGTGDTTTDPGL